MFFLLLDLEDSLPPAGATGGQFEADDAGQEPQVISKGASNGYESK